MNRYWIVAEAAELSAFELVACRRLGRVYAAEVDAVLEARRMTRLRRRKFHVHAVRGRLSAKGGIDGCETLAITPFEPL